MHFHHLTGTVYRVRPEPGCPFPRTVSTLSGDEVSDRTVAVIQVEQEVSKMYRAAAAVVEEIDDYFFNTACRVA